MNLINWSENIKFYELEGGYSLERATNTEFSIFFTVYNGANPRFRQSFEKHRKTIDDSDHCFWIKNNETKIGGVCMEPNFIGALFTIPPYNDSYKILSMLTKLLIHWSDKTKKIESFCVLPKYVNNYLSLGFRLGLEEFLRVMIRPTENFQLTYEDNFEFINPKIDNKMEIAKLFHKAFQNGVIEFTCDSIDKCVSSIEYYFEHNSNMEVLNKSSTLIYDKTTKKLVGACLISMWEDWPLVYDIAVDPSYQRKGLCTKMLKRALSELKTDFPVLRLFVTLGNNSESVYYNLGFMPGLETYELYIPASKAYERE